MPIMRYEKNTVLDIVHVDHLRLALDEPEPQLPDTVPPANEPAAPSEPEPPTPDVPAPTTAAAPSQPKSGKD